MTSRGLRRWMVLALAVLSIGSIACLSTPAFAAGVVSAVTVAPVPSSAGTASTYTVSFTRQPRCRRWRCPPTPSP